jgi:hypothetical protein
MSANDHSQTYRVLLQMRGVGLSSRRHMVGNGDLKESFAAIDVDDVVAVASGRIEIGEEIETSETGLPMVRDIEIWM